MANDVNDCKFTGRLGKDSETRYSPDGKAVTSFSIAVGSSYKDKQGQWIDSAEWVNVTVFGKLAENLSNFLRKGVQVFVSGKINTRKWQDKEGKDRYSTGIIADNIIISRDYEKKVEIDESVPQSKPAKVDYGTGGMENFDSDVPFNRAGACGLWRSM